MKKTERYDLDSELNSDTNWCEPHDHVSHKSQSRFRSYPKKLK
jgi:hypothetical protein